MTTRDPVVDPSAGFIGAGAHRARDRADARADLSGWSSSAGTARSPIAATGRAPIRRGGLGRRSSSRSSSCCGCRALLELPDRPVHDRPRARRRSDPVGGALTAAPRRPAYRLAYARLAPSTPSPSQEARVPVADRHSPRPSPTPTPRPASPPPSRPPAPRSSSCPTGSTPTRSRRSRSTRRRPGSPRRCARHGYEVEHPAGQPRDRDPGRRGAAAAGATARGSGSSPSTTRCPASATAAATTRWPPRASARRSPWPSIADELPGEIVFLGTPAEERGSGKQIMIDDGLFDGLDAALLYHPCDRNHVESQPLASEDVDVVFTGLQAHASSDPWRGRNALDAMILLFTSVGLWRQQLRPTARVHGIIREGGTAANIIPDRTVGLVHDPQRRRDRLRADARALPGDVRGGRTRDRHDRRGDVLRRRSDDAQQPGPGRALPGQHGRLRHRGPGRRPERRQSPTWPTSAGSARPSTPSSRSRRGHARPLDPVPRRGGPAPGRRGHAARRHPRRPDRVRAVRRIPELVRGWRACRGSCSRTAG